MHRPAPPRYNSYHGPKQRLLGNQAGSVAPAWRFNSAPASAVRRQQVAGSKILLSQLPLDVGEREVEELFKKTVGPLKDSFLIYNNQGKSKGMAVVIFQRSGDAMIARSKYNGKFIDGRRPIRIEVVTESNQIIPTGPASSNTPTGPPSLLDRLDQRVSKFAPTAPSSSHAPILNHRLPRQAAAAASIAKATLSVSQVPQEPITRRRVKKGPKRLKKQNVEFPKFTPKTKKTREQLDQEMEDYRALSSDGL